MQDRTDQMWRQHEIETKISSNNVHMRLKETDGTNGVQCSHTLGIESYHQHTLQKFVHKLSQNLSVVCSNQRASTNYNIGQ